MAPRARTGRGTFGGAREVLTIGLERAVWRDAYHTLLTMSWRRFFALVLAGYLAVNTVFALGYEAMGDAIENARAGSFVDDFFFSVQTLATIGYGKLVPRTLGANALVAFEALIGMVGIAVTTGLVYARFSRPTARVVFSREALITRFDGAPAFVFRMANARANQVGEARLKLTMLRSERSADGEWLRRQHELPLRRSESPVFALTWTAVHPITPASPLHGVTAEDLRAGNVDVVASLSGIDDGLGTTIYARHAWRGEDRILFDRRFVDIFSQGEGGQLVIDYRRFHDTEPLPESPTQGA